MTSPQHLTDLTNISQKALTDYDELLSKYNKLLSEHEETKDELNQLQQVAEPMYNEYGEIQSRYEMEKSLRTAAETYATQVVKDNKKIKRQSAMIVAQMSSAQPIAIDIDIEEGNSVQDERIDELSKTITKLQDEIVGYEKELQEAKDEISIMSTETDTIMAEREEYRMKCISLEQDVSSTSIAVKRHQRELKSLNRVSTLAVVDYSSMEDRYETEKALRLKAESYAQEMQRKLDSAQDSSQATANGDVGEDDGKLTKLKAQNDQLHSELSELEIKFKLQIEELEQNLKDSTSHETIENLEEKLEVVKDDLDRLHEELETQRSQNKDLKNKIAKMERESNEHLKIPLPPPPPPPPGPIAGIGRLIVSKKKKKQQKLEQVVGTAVVNEAPAMKNAMDEMMARIKSGTTSLRRVDMTTRTEDMEPNEEADGSMRDMHQYLVSMKRRQRERSPKRTDNIPDELQKKLAARRDISNSTELLNESTPQGSRYNTVATEDSAKDFKKQPSLGTPPVPKPRPRIATKTNKAPNITNELASKLNAALNRIPGDDVKT